MPINAAWHKQHRMPRNAKPAERLKWNIAHAKHCSCRPFTAAARRKLEQAVAKARAKRA